MKKIYLLFHTIRHLKLIQLIDRIRRRFKKTDVKLSSTPSLRLRKQRWKDKELIQSSYISESKYRFLNLEGDVGSWNDTDKSKLWLYNLHYFDDLNAIGSLNRRDSCVSLINSWIKENPPLSGNGWEPYPLSLRIVNWIKFFYKHEYDTDNSKQSLYLQVHVLRQNLEYHLLGNHLFANAKALVFAGCYFNGEVADEWLKKGLEILEAEVSEQILHDGGNFELSPMYHNIILADMLDLYQLSLVYPDLIPQSTKLYWCKTIGKMLEWAALMRHPDGNVSFFNDSALNVAPTVSALYCYANKLQLLTPSNSDMKKVNYLESSGYVVVKNDAMNLIIDVAKVGPDYIPGHAHADTLSFEMSIDNYRVFVNSGTSTYGVGEERLRQRKTESHNTVVVDGKDSSEVWSGFRVARRAYPSEPCIIERDHMISVECSHDGYMRLSGKVTHTRKWQLEPDGLLIQDRLSGEFNHAEAHYHLHPNVQIEDVNSDCQVLLLLPSGARYRVSVEGASIKTASTTWHPEFGLSIENKKLVLNFQQNEIKFVLTRV